MLQVIIPQQVHYDDRSNSTHSILLHIKLTTLALWAYQSDYEKAVVLKYYLQWN